MKQIYTGKRGARRTSIHPSYARLFCSQYLPQLPRSISESTADELVECAFDRLLGVGGVTSGVEVVYEGWGVAVSIIAAMQEQRPLPPSPYPRWLEISDAELGDPVDMQRRAEHEVSMDSSQRLPPPSPAPPQRGLDRPVLQEFTVAARGSIFDVFARVMRR